MRYTFGLYRNSQSFDEPSLRRILEALERLNVGFFPASFWAGQHEKLVLHRAEDYSREIIPDEYFIHPGFARIPFEAENGSEFAFEESNNPSIYPATFILQLSDQTANKWKLSGFLNCFRAIVESFSPSYGYVFDQDQIVREGYAERRFATDIKSVPIALFWINYYGRSWVSNIGTKRLEDLRQHVPAFDWLDDGSVLFAIQEEPYDENNEQHVEHQHELEARISFRKTGDSDRYLFL